MSDLLTTKELQDLLKLDRTTIYRMLSDGRLKGVKVGNQWRFPRESVQALLSATPVPPPTGPPAVSHDILPISCIQPIQDVFAEIAQVSALTTAPDGQPLTSMSGACRFCTLIMDSPGGRDACIASWRALATQSDPRPRFTTCHAGLHYARARIEVNGSLQAMVVAGQFYAASPDLVEEERRVHALAERHAIDPGALRDAARAIPIVDERKEAQIGSWMEKIARTFEHFGRERSDMMSRLRRIADISDLTGT